MDLKNIKVSRDEKRWEVEVRAEVPQEVLARHREHTLKDLQRTAKLDGFRPGKAPIERVVQVYGEDAIQKRVIEHSIEHELPELLAKENVMIIESPRVTTEAPTAGKDVAFTARAALAPTVVLGNYKKVAAKANAVKEDTTVTEKEHSEAMVHLRRERHRIDKLEAGIEPQKAHEESRAAEMKDLPELDDAFAQSLGYESADKFSDALRSNIQNEKELRAKDKRRNEILDGIVKESTIHYPAVLREYELDDMESRLKDDLSRSGLTWDAYLKETKKTEEEIRESWQDAADKRTKVRLILSEIARKENIEADQKQLEHELDHAKQHYPQADPQALRAHIVHALRNEATLKFLESISE